MRLVLDTHIFLGLTMAFLEAGSPFLERDNISICLSDDLFDEYIGRAGSHGFRSADIFRNIQQLESQGHLLKKGRSHCDSIDVPNQQLQGDKHIIQLAVASNADYILTNDFDDLLVYYDKILREFNIETLKPEECDIHFY